MKPRLVALLTLGVCLLAISTPLAPAGAQEVAQPKVTASHAPDYPPVARYAGWTGKVVVEVKVDAAGAVTVAQSKGGHPFLVKPAEEAARRWRFEPAPGAAERTALLTFDFGEPSCDGVPVMRSPYHMEVGPAFEPPQDTVSYIPEDFEHKRCPLHRQRLNRDKVEIIYGLVLFKPEYVKAEKRRFPYANDAAYGGCVITTVTNPCTGKEVLSDPKFAEVMYCRRCRAAKQAWAKTHRQTRG